MHSVPLRLLLAVLALVAVATGLVACGSDDDLSSKSAQDVLKTTFGPNKPVRSGRLDVAVGFQSTGLQGVSGPIALELHGPFSSNGVRTLPSFDFDAAVSASGQDISAGATAVGGKGFIKFGGQTFAIPDDLFAQFKTLYEQDQKGTGDKGKNPTFSALGVDPSRWLKSPTKAGDAQVGGTDTVHVTSQVDVPAFLGDVSTLLTKAGRSGVSNAAVPTSLTAAQRDQIERSVQGTSLDVYAGKSDGTLRKLDLKVNFSVPADVQRSAGGLKSGSLTFSLTIADLNKPQTITAPKSSRPLSDLTAAATGATGATGASGAGTTATAPSAGTSAAPATGTAPATGASTANSKYLKCLDAAKADIAKAQKCAPLLNGG